MRRNLWKRSEWYDEEFEKADVETSWTTHRIQEMELLPLKRIDSE